MMVTDELKKQIIEVIKNYVKNESLSIYLFGSNADGSATERSDIDICIDIGKRVDSKVFVELQEALNNEIPILRKIDLVDFYSLDEKFRAFSLNGAERWN